MKGIIAYSKPRGKFGHDYVFTVVIDFDESHEEATIDVREPGRGTYSCGFCGSYGNVRIKRPNETSVQGSLHFYRYDNVHDGDQINISFSDPGLIFSQSSNIFIGSLSVRIHTGVHASEEVRKELPDPVYPMFLINWDEHVEKQRTSQRPVTVEEELITKVMNNEPITVTELLLEPAKQPLRLESGNRFIEGQLKYL
jgi:hypothetical protein